MLDSAWRSAAGACQFLFWAVVSLNIDCGAAGPLEPGAVCLTGDVWSEMQSLVCREEQSPQPLPASCAGDCAALDGPAVTAALSDAANLTTAGLFDRYPATFSNALGYDPLKAANLDRLGQTEMVLSDAETAALAKNGFVISAKQRFPTFAYGYSTLYMHHLPVFVSADAVLHAVHRSYDQILAQLEQQYLMGELQALLTELQLRLVTASAAGFSAAAIADADVYLATAQSLLQDQVQQPVAGGSQAAVADLFNLAHMASGSSLVTLFGDPMEVDFSQFTPRGHYSATKELTRYFRCMMWLGRIEMRLSVTDTKQALTLQRGPLETAFLLTWLHGADAQRSRQNIDAVLRAFVGEPDDMTPEQMTQLLSTLGVKTPAELAARSDSEVLQALVAGGYGVQRIVSQILEGGLYQTAQPPRSFLLLGQRYVADSQVLSNVVYDRVGGGRIERTLPSALDVAFAALHNNQAAALLRPELLQYSYAPDLAAMRVLLDGHGEAYWQSNLYTSWLGALRALSPDQSATVPASFGLPAVAGTEAWGRRMLNTQLASWAELRHDTVLYAKQAYGSRILCDFPDAYVDPYPRFYGAVAMLADRGVNALQALSSVNATVVQAVTYFEQLAQVARMLGEMAEFQRAQRPFTDAHMAFINEMIWGRECGSVSAPGWYLNLFWDRDSAQDFDPTIADVYTDANSGRVFQVGTGMARLLVVTANTCQGVRAYFGFASSYFEVQTDALQRLDDEAWAQQLRSSEPTSVGWLRDLMGQ